VAILLDDAVRRALGEAIEHLRSAARDVAWVAPDNLHVTLKFLGAVPETRIESVAGALRDAGLAVRSFEARIRGLGAFPSIGRPRVVWAGVTDGASEMTELARRVDIALTALGFVPEERPFSPHVTLGRMRRPEGNGALTDALERATARDYGRIQVPSAFLMRSQLGPRGARYSELVAVRLGGPV
jgi:RNA 2',3'-cyclic 3'-phosphodiesterase